MRRFVWCCLCVLVALPAAGGRGEARRARSRPAAAPTVERVPLPASVDGDAIWGATGRDRRGHIWFGVSSHAEQGPSARLYEYDPAAGKVRDRGDVLGALKKAGRYRKGECQAKIHSRIVLGADGHLYFTSMDEQGEDPREMVPPKWGSHLWRLRLPGAKWEHLMAAPEGLIAAAAGGRYVYALGYYGHKLYQYDIRTGRRRSVTVGAAGGHVSRNFFADRAGHVYVPRVTVAQPGDRPAAALVELDARLRQVAATPLTHYGDSAPAQLHGIVGFQPLGDGSIAFTTHVGRLYRVRPAAAGRAKVIDLGWFHPVGGSYATSLFLGPAGRLVGVARRRGGRYKWVSYDLAARKATAADFDLADDDAVDLARTMLYGSVTRDNHGHCYIAGAMGLGHHQYTPILLKIRPPR